jgi:hypothetical protein
MRRASTLAIVGLFLFSCGIASGVAEDKSPAALEQEYQKQSNPRKQADLARKLLELRLGELRVRIGADTMIEKTSPELEHYSRAVTMLANAVRKASHSGTSKNAEKELRDQSHDLNDMKMSVSAAERPYLEQLISKVSKLRDELLYGLMLPPEEEREEAAQK